MMKDYALIDHTADFGIIVTGKDYADLFTKAAEAMFDVMAEKAKQVCAEETKTMAIELCAEDIDELLLDWLSELHSLSDSKNLIFTDFQIQELNTQKIKADVQGVPRKYFSIIRDIKAVTYHHLKIEKKNDYYQTTIIFDL